MTPNRKTTLSARSALADRLRRVSTEVSEEVVEEFLGRHPDWLERYGERARKLGIMSVGFHLDFLAGALESHSVAAFEDYTRWAVRMLAARRIAPHFVAENLEQIEQATASRLDTEAHRFLAEFLAAGRRVCHAPPADEAPAAANGKAQGLAAARSLFLQAILLGRRQAALNAVLGAVREGFSLQEIYLRVFQESLYEVGRRWARNEITVAQEHMATAVTQHVIAQMYPRLETSAVSRGKLVIAGVEGEFHQLGAHMVADYLEADGWDVLFLGTNMPHSGILRALEEHQAESLGISATMLFSIPQVIRLVREVRDHFGERSPQILLGGRAFRHGGAVVGELAVAGTGNDLKDALELARRISPRSGER